MNPATVDPAEKIRRAQERALRAARAVTLTLTAALAGCSGVVTGVAADAPVAEAEAADAPAADAPAAEVAADAPVAEADAGDADDAVADAGAADAEVCATAGDAALSWAECCDRIGWDWNRGCAAWGPFMPPSMEG